MLPISTAEQASIQADAAAAALDQTCQIQRKTITKDNFASATEGWNTIATVKAGLSEPTGGQLQNYDFKIGSLAAWQVKLPVGTDVKEQDHLVIGSQTLVVQVVLTPRSYAGLLTLLASEVK